MREPTFRLASDGDVPGIRDVVVGALREFGLDIEPGGEDADLDSVERSYNDAGGRFWVLTSKRSRIIGTVGVLDEGDGVCELRKMYLAPDWRGKGWGRFLLIEALRFAREAGFRKVTLNTNSSMLDAIALYERNGFRRLPACANPCTRCDLTFEMEL